MYIYIYVYTEYLYIYVCIYIGIYIYINMGLHIHIWAYRDMVQQAGAASARLSPTMATSLAVGSPLLIQVYVA